MQQIDDMKIPLNVIVWGLMQNAYIICPQGCLSVFSVRTLPLWAKRGLTVIGRLFFFFCLSGGIQVNLTFPAIPLVTPRHKLLKMNAVPLVLVYLIFSIMIHRRLSLLSLSTTNVKVRQLCVFSITPIGHKAFVHD